MDPAIVYGGLVAALSTVFAIAIAALKSRADDAETRYQDERAERKEIQRVDAENSRRTGETLLRLSASLDALMDKVDQIPKRRDDYEAPRREHGR